MRPSAVHAPSFPVVSAVGLEFCTDAPFCGARAYSRFGRRGGNFVLVRPSAVHALSFLVVSAVRAGILS
jgi:hypothetical protein